MTDYQKWEEAVEKITPPDGSYPPGMVEEWRRFLAEPRRWEDVFKTNLLFPLQRQAEMRRMLEIAKAVGRAKCGICVCTCGADRTGPSAEAHSAGCPAEKDCPACGNKKYVGGPATVMEIGADKGGGVWSWCHELPVHNMIACEKRGTPYAEAFEAAFPAIDFHWVDLSSQDPFAVRGIERWLGKRRIDVMFIDGDKGAMLKDFHTYLPLMNPQGVVFFHDINERGPMRDAFEDVKMANRFQLHSYKTEEIIDKSDWLAVLKKEAEHVRQGASLNDMHKLFTPHENWLRHWAGRSCGVGVVWLGGGA